jgi:PKD repeat protein
VVEFVLDAEGSNVVSGPVTLVEYTGSGKASAAGISAGPDGLYFTDLYQDLGATSPTDAGANVLRIRFVGAADFAADRRAGPTPLSVQFTNRSTLTSGPIAWRWEFGDTVSSTNRDPSHVYITEGMYDVRLRAVSSNGLRIQQKAGYVRVGDLGEVLLVVGETNLVAGDVAARDRIEALGYGPVEVRSGLAVQAGDADGKALVVISSSVLSGDVNTKFRNLALPVVTWEENLLDDLGMTDAGDTNNSTVADRTGLTIADSSVFLATGLSGAVEVVTTPDLFAWGRPNTNAIVVAMDSADPGLALLFAYERDALMEGLIAPARRLSLFLTDLTATHLTREGKALFDAAIIWAMGHEQDTDADGVTDRYDLDDDGDGMSDYYEDFFGLNRLSHTDAVTDTDGDGVVNIEEAQARTDPRDSNDVLRLQASSAPGQGSIVFTWPGRNDVTYQVQRTDILETGSWVNVNLPLTPAEDTPLAFTNPPSGPPARFFRVLLP